MLEKAEAMLRRKKMMRSLPRKKGNLAAISGDGIRKNSFSHLPLSWAGKDQHKCLMLK